MQNRTNEGPLSSEELERDRAEAGTDSGLTASDAPGHTLPASEAAAAAGPEEHEDKGSGTAPGSVSGTILPPD